MQNKPSLYALTLAQWQDYCTKHGFKPFVAKQLYAWLYQRYASLDQMHNLPKAFKEALHADFEVRPLEVLECQQSADKSVKYLFKTFDGHSFESVYMLMREAQEGGAQEKITLCLSCQIGCKVGCVFCATAKGGFVRDLNAGEIVEQVVALKRAHQLEPTKGINLVFMGMGEPLHNFEQVVRALEILSTHEGLNIAPRRITISTSGVVPALQTLGALNLGVQLAISLHAVNDTLRSKLMPINKLYNLESLISALKAFPLDKRKRVMFEYLMIKDTNDSLSHAKELLRLLNGLKAKINLIPYNSTPHSRFERPKLERVQAFADFLNQKGLLCTIRISKGQDIAAGCGQLREKRLTKEES
ncbi:23S rRNA (adenine(2503)-C(2))-methyltransferase RlmN [Helicobacter labacensis]|uniref:23S rRNA (adenine(2503)-C(2))-methyltransferase RlmN n=1 Tax=Helicobacter labacensis TaxID=2316079 RepID=UPI000EB155D8|nr:23S rRNA (adenine(2503)-C(2))-methyltransferase RlmN [Helicobacter labacensis]